MIFRTHRQSRKDIMDDDLACLRLWRKPIAKDDCSLYRAISEQLFLSQVHHEVIRDKVIAFIDKHQEKLKSEWTTRSEFLAISLLFRCDIIVYQFGRPPIDLTLNNFDKKVHLCVSGGNHYDCVYPYIFKEVGAICQSLLYDILYRKVFKVGDEIIKEGLDILHCKQYHRNKRFTDRGEHSFRQDGNVDSHRRWSPCKDLPPHPPFPYRVAKALDPVIYRNVEYDNWVDSVKECSADQEPTFQMGDKCQVILEKEPDKVYYAHIQDITAGKGPVTVFIEELGEKHTVEHDRLRPVPQPHHYDPKRKGKKKDQYFLPFSRSGLVLGVKVREEDRHSEVKNQDELENEPRSSPSHDHGKPSYDDSWNGKPRQYLNSIGHPIKVKWNGVTVKYPHKHDKNRYQDDRHEFNRNTNHQDGGYHSVNYRHNQRNGYEHNTHRDHHRDQSLGQHQHHKYKLPSPPAQRDFRPALARQDNYQHPLPVNAEMNKDDFISNAVFMQNNGYPPMNNGTSMSPTYSSQFLLPPPMSMAMPPPPTYDSSTVSYPLSMYPYFVVPPVDGTTGQVNFTVGPSQDPCGNDLPVSDPSTLRYFYNLGYECHRLSNFHLGQPPQAPPLPCVPNYPNAPMMLQGGSCPSGEDYLAENMEAEMPPGVMLQNDWNERGEVTGFDPGCHTDFLMRPPPPCLGDPQQVPQSPTGQMPNLNGSIPISIAPQASGPIYPSFPMPMQWNALPMYNMPPPSCEM